MDEAEATVMGKDEAGNERSGKEGKPRENDTTLMRYSSNLEVISKICQDED